MSSEDTYDGQLNSSKNKHNFKSLSRSAALQSASSRHHLEMGWWPETIQLG